MIAVEAAAELPSNVDVVPLELLGRRVEFSVVHSWHLFIQNTPHEVLGASALLLEHGASSDPNYLLSALNIHQYQRLAELSTKPENPLPLVFIDAVQMLPDILKMGGGELARGATAMASGYLLYRTVVNAKRGLTRRAFLQSAGASALSLSPLTSLLSAMADYRADAKSGQAARWLSALDDRNPLQPNKIVLALRNRIFAFKSLLAAQFLIRGIPDDPTWTPLVADQLPRFPLIVGAAHTDVARHLRRNLDDLSREIAEMCKSYQLTEEFVASVFSVQLAKYDAKRQGWQMLTVVDAKSRQ